MPTTQRRPFWSDALTTPLAAITPPDRRPVALLAIKAIHTAAFAVIGGATLLFTWDGLTRRRGRRAGSRRRSGSPSPSCSPATTWSVP